MCIFGLFRPGFLVQSAQVLQERIVRLSELQAIQAVPRVRRDLDRCHLDLLRGHGCPSNSFIESDNAYAMYRTYGSIIHHKSHRAMVCPSASSRGPGTLRSTEAYWKTLRAEARRTLTILPGTWPFCQGLDRKSTRLNSSHGYISYAVFCLKKK